jgi:aspartyl-tRNA(Asn)/glutamyl-tRNA(Gln) amidotransferase subunit A
MDNYGSRSAARLHKPAAAISCEPSNHRALAARAYSKAMLADQLWSASMSELMTLIRNRAVSPVEIAGAALERIASSNEQLLAFCAVDAELVLAQARQAERSLIAGEAVGPLCGVPIGVKDLIFTRDLPTVGGSQLYADFTPDEDDIVVERLRAAGAVILGKTNVPEFGFGPGTQNAVYGTTRNPWNIQRTPGGSSGGSAAAVASGLAPAALGSDGGGSIRVPSSFCGVFGLKASFGRVPLYPGCRDERFPGFSAWESIEHIGPITRTVQDAALLLDVIAGPDSRDRHSLPREARPFVDLPAEPSMAGVRIAWTTDMGGYARVDPAVRRAVEGAVAQFAALGADVEEARPFDSDPGQIFETIVALDADIPALRRLASTDPQLFNARIAALLGRAWSFDDGARALAGRQALYNQLWRFFERYDLLLTPTTPVAAFELDRPVPAQIDGDSRVPSYCLSWFTLPFNLTGNPAASLPCGWTPDGLPIGLQIVGNHLQDRQVLLAARAFELAVPWADRWPE